MCPTEFDKIILTGVIGSHSYGTATENSDFDYMSIVAASPDLYLGLSTWGQSGTMCDEYDDPVKGLVEHQYFELKKAMVMLQNFNPNIIPLLWLEDQHYETVTDIGWLLLKNRTLFNSKKAYYTFSHYAQQQLQSMGGVFNDAEEPNKLLKKGYLRFQQWVDEEIINQRYLRDHPKMDDAKRGVNTAYDEGYLNALIALRNHSREECKRIKEGPITGRMGKKRKELREKYLFDVKYAMHVIRLMKMCVEFLNHPEQGLKVYRRGIDAEMLYSIRTGALKQEEIKAMAGELFAQATEAFKHTSLPDEPDRAAIHNLTMDMLRLAIA